MNIRSVFFSNTSKLQKASRTNMIGTCQIAHMPSKQWTKGMNCAFPWGLAPTVLGHIFP